MLRLNSFFRVSPFLLLLLFSACSQPPVKSSGCQPAECVCPKPGAAPGARTPGQTETTLMKDFSLLRPASWEEMEGFEQDNLAAAWPVWLQSCSVLKNKQPQWQTVCAAATALQQPGNAAIKAYFRQYFSVYRTTNADNTDTGLITGYYQPLLKGSRYKTNIYRYPIYAKPDDLITVELGSLYPELANKRVRGRLVNNKLIPYYNRAEIETEPSPLRGKELLWVNDSIDLFFLQVQGSGLVKLEKSAPVHVGYADQNGQTYQSIGRLLVERGELTTDKASMQGIKDWARNNPEKLRDLLNSNPSYVFFREMPNNLPGPIGSLGVPIAAERSVAVDPRQVPLGAPVFLSTTYPNSNKTLQRLMLAQDTGGAIKGGVRADFFWGTGTEAGKQAGAMKQKGRIWVLLPKNMRPDF